MKGFRKIKYPFINPSKGFKKVGYAVKKEVYYSTPFFTVYGVVNDRIRCRKARPGMSSIISFFFFV